MCKYCINSTNALTLNLVSSNTYTNTNKCTTFACVIIVLHPTKLVGLTLVLTDAYRILLFLKNKVGLYIQRV